MTATLRATVGLSADEAAALTRIQDSATPQAIALDSLTGITLGGKASTAQQVHALIVAGLQAVEKEAERIGYRDLAEFLKTDDESRAWRESRRSRALKRFAA
jgi:hypothetical protein